MNVRIGGGADFALSVRACDTRCDGVNWFGAVGGRTAAWDLGVGEGQRGYTTNEATETWLSRLTQQRPPPTRV